MTRTEYLLACLSEECAEVIKEIGKIHRFGMHNVRPEVKNFIPNTERLSTEIVDVIAVVDMLRDEDVINHKINPIFTDDKIKIAINKKKDKVEMYIRYAEKSGTITKE